MAFKFLTAFVLMAVAVSAQQYVQQHLPIGAAVYHSAPAAVLHAHPAAVVHAAPVVQHVELEAPAKYAFSYSVHDSQTGDIKAQNEHRDGDNVQGSYSLVDADGLHRTVDYTADEVNGFNAVVRREPLAVAAHAVHAVPAVAVAHY